jgi:F-type H+-transporting ATPase subunit epsilon
MKTEILTPEALIFTGDADVVTLPGEVGSFQILEGHAPIISTLAKGTITVKNKAEVHTFLATGGVVEVANGNVSVLAEAILA